jgi:hypothetical protein
VGAGFAYFSVGTQDPELKRFHIPEYRGQQDVTVRQSLKVKLI